MNALLNKLNGLVGKKTAALALAAAGACFSMGATDARADEHYRGGGRERDQQKISIDFDLYSRSRGGFRDDCDPPVRIERRETRVWVEPVCRTVCDRVWVDAEYRTVCEKVFVPPVTRTVCEKVWVPDRFECRTVVRRDRHGYTFRSEERVLIEPGHFTSVERVVEVAPGHYDSVERRVLVREGYLRTVERQEVVAPGHWEYSSGRVVEERHEERRDDLRIGFEYHGR